MNGSLRPSEQRAISAGDPRIARRRAEEELADTLLVGEQPHQNCASEASTSPSGELCDEVGGYKARSARSELGERGNQTQLLVNAVGLIDRRDTAYGAQHVVQVGGVRGLEGELGAADAVLAGVQGRGQDVDVLVR